jgi:hypothetical protein
MYILYFLILEQKKASGLADTMAHSHKPPPHPQNYNFVAPVVGKIAEKKWIAEIV